MVKDRLAVHARNLPFYVTLLLSLGISFSSIPQDIFHTVRNRNICQEPFFCFLFVINFYFLKKRTTILLQLQTEKCCWRYRTLDIHHSNCQVDSDDLLHRAQVFPNTSKETNKIPPPYTTCPWKSIDYLLFLEGKLIQVPWILEEVTFVYLTLKICIAHCVLRQNVIYVAVQPHLFYQKKFQIPKISP